MEHAGSLLAVRRRKTSLDCCLYSVRAFSVYPVSPVYIGEAEPEPEYQLTDSSSTLAASGRASETRNIVVDLTMFTIELLQRDYFITASTG